MKTLTPPVINPLAPVPKTMQAALFYAPNDVRYEYTPVPEVLPGELLVRVGTALTCGTDLKCYRRGHPVLLKHFPSPFGHEFAGTAMQVGEGVTQFQPGDRVVAANSAPCYECYYCRKGNLNLCEHLDLLNGAYADFIKIPAQITALNTYKLPAHVSFAAAAFTEPLAVSLRGLDLAGVMPGDHIAILGLGPIGQLLVKAAVLKGAHVTAMARSAHKRHMATTFGGTHATVALQEKCNPDELLSYSPDGRGFDVVIEAIGLPETWQLAMQLVRRGGTVNLFGGCPSGTAVPLDTRRMHYDEIRLISSFHHTPPFFGQAVELITSGQIDPLPLISDTLPMSAAVTALERMEKGEAFKVALVPDTDLSL